MIKTSLFGLCLAALLLQGCGKKENNYRPTAQELRLNLLSEPPTLDPRKATDASSARIINMCFEGLTRLNSQGEPELAAAEQMDVSEDGMRYTFTLRNAYWSDGVAVTAQNFEKTWKTILSPSFPTEFGLDFFFIKNAKAAKFGRCSVDDVGIKALDDATFQIDLDHPVPYLLYALSNHYFFPSPTHVTEKDPEWTLNNYICNGAFRMTHWRHYNSIQLEKNLHYWDKENVTLEKISFVMIQDPTTALSMYENHELDWVGTPFSSIPEDAILSLKKQGLLHEFPVSGTYYYIFNTTVFPFHNANMRRAFALAINRQAIIDCILQSGQKPAMGMIPPTMWKDNPPYFADHDITEARRLFQLGLNELQITAAELPLISLTFNTESAHHKIAQAIQQQWNEAFGIQVTLENKEWKVYLDEIRCGKFQIARMGGIASVNDPSTFLDAYRYLSSGGNNGQWSNPLYSELLEQADKTANLQERTDLLKKAEKILIEDMPVAPIYYYSGNYIKPDYIKNVYLSDLMNIDLKWAYVETASDALSR